MLRRLPLPPRQTRSGPEGRATLRPRTLLRVEGFALLIAAVALYSHVGGSWWLFALLLFLPDLSAVGYVRGPRLGADAYNLAHTTALPIALGVVGLLVDSDPAVRTALVWLAHVGLDRALGYGLKEASGFFDTHLGRIGKSAAPASERTSP